MEDQMHERITLVLVDDQLDFIRLEWENHRLRAMITGNGKDNLLGESSVMRQVRQSIEAVVGTDYPVLIQGESGTGKELASRMVHRFSTRAQRPYLAVNCPAIPDSLLESELFGYCAWRLHWGR